MQRKEMTAQEYNSRGFVCDTEGRLDEAIAAYTKAIELNPEYAIAYNNRGSAYDAQGKHDKAIADCIKAIKLNPKYATAYNNLGFAYDAQKRLDEAIAAYTKAIELNPEYAIAYNNRGSAYDAQGKRDKAIADYTKAIELKPNNATVYCNRGVAYEFQGKLDEAITDYTNALKLKPEYELARRRRWRAYKALELLQLLSVMDDAQARKKFANEEKYKLSPTYCVDVLLRRAAKLNELIRKDNLTFDQAQGYLRSSKDWLFLFQGQELVKNGTFHLDTYFDILPFIVGCSSKDTKKIFDALHNKILVDRKENHLTKLKSGLFSIEEYEDKNREAVETYYKRVAF